MGTPRVAFSELTQPVQSFLDQIRRGGSIAVEDSAAGVTFRVTLCHESSPEAKQKAVTSLAELQANVDQSMSKQGVSEADVDQLLIEDD